MSYNGSGVFNINTAGQPVVTGTVISSTAFNALTADLATGLTTALTKDGQTTPTANIPMGGFKITGIAAATTTGDALSYGRAATVTSISASSVTDSGLTSGRVTYASTSGLLADSASLRFDGTSLGVGGAPTVNAGQTSVTVNGTSNARLDMQIGGTNTAGLVVSSSAAYLQTLTAIPLIFYTNSAEVARFDSSGNLGIGVTPSSWQYKVLQLGRSASLASSTATYNNFFMGNNVVLGSSNTYLNNGYTQLLHMDNDGNYNFNMSASGTAGNAITFTTAMKLDASGNLFVQCTAQPSGSVPGFEIVKNGTTSSYFITGCTSTAANTVGDFYNPNGRVGGISISGSATTFSTSSDYRLKENVQPMSGALTTITQLNPVTFKWKADGSDSHGFIAHELQAIVPECVTGKKDETKEEQYEITPAIPAVLNEDGNVVTEAIPAVMGTRTVPVYQGIDTSFLVATLTAAIQELNARLTALESK
jgi:hypothetical protein